MSDIQEFQSKDIVADPTQEALNVLSERFGSQVSPDDRKNYTGLVVDRDALTDVARIVRDELGYDYLSSATAVDYLGYEDGDYLEMVYHCYRTTGGAPLVLKSRTPRDVATLPSVVSIWPGADFQEREAYDLYGIYFNGHPNMKRILLWEGFEGHPMRKDWREAYYEEEHKPFGSRWPAGHVTRAEEFNPFGRNVKYPEGFTMDQAYDVSEVDHYEGLNLGVQIEGGIQTDRLVVNLGPHHPSTHGVFRMVVTLNGETVETLEPVMGYLHRNHEKIGERNTWGMNMPFTDRLDYISSMSNNLGYALAVEELMAKSDVKGFSQPTERAELIRVLMVELTRYVSHTWSIGFLLNDMGAFFTPALYGIWERELILDFFEATAGSRMMCNYMRFGGVAYDIPARLRAQAILENDVIRDFDTMDFLRELIFERMPRFVDEYHKLLTSNEIVISRAQGVGILPPELAIAYSTSGPVLRGSGIPYDVRRAQPYSIYPELEFDIPVGRNGDVYDRYLVRLEEMRQSVRILQQVYPRLKETAGMPVFGLDAYAPRISEGGEAYGRVENPKGELGYYIIGRQGKEYDQNPWRYHVRAPSFINLTALEEMCKGHKVADIVVILGSIDIVLGEVDR
ncbi:MAG: NADH-quinone oxidoreductase subunit NuoD [Phototrophicales bacterium]|nr:MAG: NADH-quinone oxidoreductase subunit NuoD [Phototrophicales bacterium]